MFWRMAGIIRSMFGISRRRMSGKRLFVGVLCTVCLTLGIYLKYFNHESADELLHANRQEALNDAAVMAKPRFHRLGGVNKLEKNENIQKSAHFELQSDDKGQIRSHKTEADVKEGVRTLRSDEKNHDDGVGAQLREVGKLYDATKKNDDGAAKGDEGNKNDVVDEEEKDKRIDKWADGEDGDGQDDREQGVHDEQFDDEGDAAHDERQDNERDDAHINDEKNHVNEALVPFERDQEGEEEDEKQNEEQRDAGGNGGERMEEDDNVGAVVDGGNGGGDGAHREGGRGPHGIKLFDWDKWVKDNDFVELGNIWGYCDDEDPPVIGKVLLLTDEENGGLKNVIIFNITLEYDVVMGNVEVSIDFNDMHFYSNKFDFEELETESEFFKTPIAKGDHYFVREQHISSLVPKGQYYGESRIIDQNDKTIVCSTMHLTMK